MLSTCALNEEATVYYTYVVLCLNCICTTLACVPLWVFVFVQIFGVFFILLFVQFFICKLFVFEFFLG